MSTRPPGAPPLGFPEAGLFAGFPPGFPPDLAPGLPYDLPAAGLPLPVFFLKLSSTPSERRCASVLDLNLGLPSLDLGLRDLGFGASFQFIGPLGLSTGGFLSERDFGALYRS